MERNVQKNGLVNLVAATMIFVAAFVVMGYVHSVAGQAASIFLGLGALVAFVSWFQMRLEENERLEKLELDELVKSKGGSTLFDAKDTEVFPAQRAREQFEKFFKNKRNSRGLRIGRACIGLCQFKGTFKGIFVV